MHFSQSRVWLLNRRVLLVCRLTGQEISNTAFRCHRYTFLVIGLKSCLCQPQVSVCGLRDLGCLFTLFSHLCSLTFDICDISMEPRLFSTAFKVLSENFKEWAWTSAPEQNWTRLGAHWAVTGEALASPPWEVQLPRRCPHRSWSQWSL